MYNETLGLLIQLLAATLITSSFFQLWKFNMAMGSGTTMNKRLYSNIGFGDR